MCIPVNVINLVLAPPMSLGGKASAVRGFVFELARA
jgi:hypothetical protein